MLWAALMGGKFGGEWINVYVWLIPSTVCLKLSQHLLIDYGLGLVAQSCPTLCDPMDWSPPGSSVHGDSPGKNSAVGCHALLQGIFPTQGSNPGLPHCRQIL